MYLVAMEINNNEQTLNQMKAVKRLKLQHIKLI